MKNMASCSVTSKTLLDIEECIAELKRHFASEKTPINDDCAALHRLQEKAETVLQLGLKEKPGVFVVKRTYWDYICACFSASKRLHDGLKFIKSNSELKSSVGRGRALIRFCLVQKCLADTLQTCFIDEKTSRDFYFEPCLPLQPKLWSVFIASLYDLNELHFDLNPLSSELDVSWPSFSRKIFLPPGDQALPSVTISFPGLNDFSSELAGEKLCGTDISTDRENTEIMDNQTKNLVAANSELEADVLYLQKKCKTLEQEICDAAHTEETLETISKSAEIYSTEKDVDTDSKVNNDLSFQESSIKTARDYNTNIDSELHFKSNSDDQCNYSFKMQFSEDLPKNLQNISALENSSELSLVSSESVLAINKFDSTSTTSASLFLQKGIENLQQSETSPFHPEIVNLVQGLLLEMKVLLDTLKRGTNSVADPATLSDFARFQIITQYLEKILLLEFKKLTQFEIEKRNVEEYAFHMKSSALKQDKLICSLLDQVNSCVKENKSLHDRLCFLKDKLQSFGLLKPGVESNEEVKDNSELAYQISDVGKTSEDHVDLDVQHSHNLSNDYSESLQIFKTSSANLLTLNMQAKNLRLLLDSSHKLNDNLISRVQDQELHMKGITKQLEEAHNLLAVMRKQHQKLQSAESIVKYDLQEKRRLLNKLKQQLEATRENCNLVRLKNSKSEAEWQDLRREFVLRNKQTSEESGFIDDKSIEDQTSLVGACESDCPENIPDNEVSGSTNDMESKYELKKNRLQLLEEQCQLLCTNLKNSSKKRKELDYRLESWCKAIENSHSEASKKNNLSVIINTDKECKDNSEQASNEKINIDFHSDADSSLSSPEIGSFNSDCCSYVPNNSSAASTGLSLSLQSLKTDELISSKVDLDYTQNKSSYEHEEQNSVNSDSASKELYDDCSSKNIDNVQDSSYFGSAESLGGSEKCQAENSDSEDKLTQMKINGRICSSENKSNIISLKSDDMTKLITELEEEKNILQAKCHELEMTNTVILEQLNQKTQELQLSEATKKQEVVALQFQLNSEVLKYERAIKEYNDNNDGLKEMKQKVNDQEQLILTLEEALAEIQVEREGEKEHQWEQLQDIQLALAAREDECISLSSDIQQLEEFKTSSLKDKELLEGDILLLRNDIKELQKKIIKLLKEKDILWKMNDRLRYLHKIQIDDRWMDDHEVSHCLGCRSQFSFLLRKHHCRQCGRIFCHSCSNNWLLTPSSRRQIRVCNECYMQHIEIKTDVRRDSNVQSFDDSDDEAVGDDVSLNFNRSSSFSSEMHPSIADSMISLPAMQVTNLKQKTHFTSAPELHFNHENQEVSKRRSLNDPPLPCHLEVVENDISGNLLIKANEEAILPILNEVNSTSIAWSLEPPCEAIPISLIYEDTNHCSVQQTVLHQSSCETDGVIHLSLPGLYKFHFDNKSRSSSMLVRYSFKANILKESEISC